MFGREYLPIKGLDTYLNRFDPFARFGLLPRLAWPTRQGLVGEWQPEADIIETEKEYLVKAGVPEVKKEDIKVDVIDGMLTVTGERKLAVDENMDTVHRMETFYGTFTREFVMPEGVDVAAIRAEVAEGVLTIHLPKLPAAVAPKPVKIAIQ